jgi:thiamine biosynthesis lipoprotein
LLSRGALATSGVARRSWLQAGVRRHHLLDPGTGEPVLNDLVEVTVAASVCRVAEVAATASFVLGSDRSARFLASRQLAGLLTTSDGRKIRVGRWPSPLRDAA